MEKCHNVPFTSCRTRRAKGVGQSVSKGLRIMSSMSEARRRWVAHLEQRANLSFLCIFVLFRLSMDLTMPAHKGEGTFFTHYPNPVLVSSRNTLIVTPGHGVSPAAWASLNSVKLTHKSNHHNHPTIHSGAVALWVLFYFYDFFCAV